MDEWTLSEFRNNGWDVLDTAYPRDEIFWRMVPEFSKCYMVVFMGKDRERHEVLFNYEEDFLRWFNG